jgi:hypothetical protein
MGRISNKTWAGQWGTGDLVSGEGDLLQVDVVLEDGSQSLEALIVDLVPGKVEHLDVLVGREGLRSDDEKRKSMLRVRKARTALPSDSCEYLGQLAHALGADSVVGQVERNQAGNSRKELGHVRSLLVVQIGARERNALHLVAGYHGCIC